MSLWPTTLLGLVLCLGKTIHMQPGSLPKPSIRAEPGPVVPRGWPVTIVCQGPAGAESFRLEKDGSYQHGNQKNVSPHGSQRTEDRFRIPAVNDFTAGRYFCLYLKGSIWSGRSEPLELKVADEDVSTSPSGGPGVLSPTPSSTPITHTKPLSAAGDTQTNPQDSSNLGLSTKFIFILVGTSVAFLLCLFLLVLLLVHRQRQRKHRSPHSQGEEQKPQERSSPAADSTESLPDGATACALPEKKTEMHSPSPAAGDAEEVTYAQLDHRALTLRAAPAMCPQPTEPAVDASLYAVLPRH